MAKEQAENKTEAQAGKMQYDRSRWSVPSRRAKGYAEERKARVHKWG